MKRIIKVFILSIIITIVLMSTVFGEQFKRTIEVVYNSVNITVNGKRINEDNILYNGTTYVPLRAISESLGKTVSWNQGTYTANIHDSLDDLLGKDVEGRKKINEMKLYSKITNHYKWLQDHGEILSSTDNNISVALNGILYFKETESLSTAIKYFDQRIDWYNNLLNPTRDIILEAKNQGIDISDMNDILNNYSKAIDYYRLTFESLVRYTKYKNDIDFDNSFIYRSAAFELSNEQKLIALDKYYIYLNKILSF